MSHDWFDLAVGVAIGVGSLTLLAIIAWAIFAYKMWKRS